MFIKLVKPFPQPSLGKVIPAGVVIDAPPGLAERLLRQGIGKKCRRRNGPAERGCNSKEKRSGKGR